MTVEALLALSVFAFATSITPGPNNMMLLASGVNFGFRRTIPHMLGIGFGFTAMLVVVGLGLGAALTASPSLLTVLKLVSAGYMLWLAWRLASSGSIGSAVGAAKPMRFIEAAGFQWINPKAWALAVSFVAMVVDPGPGRYVGIAVLGVGCLVIGAASSPTWMVFGDRLEKLLKRTGGERYLGIVMAVLVVASVVLFFL